jgi:hypothetical protein
MSLNSSPSAVAFSNAPVFNADEAVIVAVIVERMLRKCS